MFVVALTGGIGSGKSEAAKVFAELGVPVTDLDAISHQLTAANQPLMADIKANFGDACVTNDGAINRVAMRKLIFSDDNARTKLNAIMHPAIFDEALLQLQAKQTNTNNAVPYQILAIPLLFDSPRYLPHINRILLIDCDEKTQLLRVQQRSKLTVAEIKQIIKSQTPRKKRLLLSNDVIENNKSVAELREKIQEIHKKYLNTCIVSKSI